ncbi:hypothetical protein AC231_07905 [Clostridium pasteurianum]|nr:hypothetical protein [Clostridium pasteurianum]AOZ76338.1 hypothetical protein AQ983_14975 [Clostridium pasteurianum DSM 525 = ATCC 6013]AOZ80135.1 hypothetical protein AQ984_14970 [Clostridium pasteurianum]ELP59085.1 hypothetical protein F502_11386 [Clostridium pasteurianum DSM 525 = ATCC 6013]OMH20608.1 hypothetical protein AC231_07905 [Clostridium pasteurianum]
MVRSQEAIEKYVNLLAIAYSFTVILPFINKAFSKYQFKSPQVTKNTISYQMSKELILRTFVQKLQKNKIQEEVLKVINSLASQDNAS